MRYLLLPLMLASAAYAQDPKPAPNDYSDPKSWLCRPGQHDACEVDLTTTVIEPGGKLRTEKWTADPKALIDCFYVYPTISTDPTPYSDMTPDPAEMGVIRIQFARFGSVCRTYAPMYRQLTLAGLRQLMAKGGSGASLSTGIQYDDVKDAWNYYLEHDNKGRGVVLIGHSQGSFILTELIRNEIDGKPVQKRLVSAILPGAPIAIAKGKDVGGAFQHIPLCSSASQTGCLIAYSAFRSTVPPPANTRFGRTGNPETVAACVNPAALTGGTAELHSYFSTEGRTIVNAGGNAGKPKPWAGDQTIPTPWVSVPGLVTARCTSNEFANYLEVTVHSDPAGKRTDDVTGDLTPDWGLHLIDVNLAQGNLIDIVREQGKHWH